MAITLIGYRGTGKTTVGAELAQRLGWDFVDIDVLVEQQAGMCIADIFSQQGELHFRSLESSVLADQLKHPRTVVSAGGGAVLDELNRKMMREAGEAIWLQAGAARIAERLQNDATTLARRPSLTGTDPLTEIAHVLEQRQPLYQQTASMTIDTDHRSPTEIVDEILARLPCKYKQRGDSTLRSHS